MNAGSASKNGANRFRIGHQCIARKFQAFDRTLAGFFVTSGARMGMLYRDQGDKVISRTSVMSYRGSSRGELGLLWRCLCQAPKFVNRRLEQSPSQPNEFDR